jgi:transcriptional regulator with XRE-family HTH domain
MPKKPSKPSSLPIGDRLRTQRVDVLGKSIRDVAKLVDCAPIHLSDIETGKRVPSEELLVRIARVYQLTESELRAGFSRPEAIVAEVASESTVAAKKVPEFLRTARGLTTEQWDSLIKQAKKISGQTDSSDPQ